MLWGKRRRHEAYHWHIYRYTETMYKSPTGGERGGDESALNFSHSLLLHSAPNRSSLWDLPNGLGIFRLESKIERQAWGERVHLEGGVKRIDLWGFFPCPLNIAGLRVKMPCSLPPLSNIFMMCCLNVDECCFTVHGGFVIDKSAFRQESVEIVCCLSKNFRSKDFTNVSISITASSSRRKWGYIYIYVCVCVCCLVWCMGVKLYHSYSGRNTGWGCLKIGCRGRYLDLRVTR
jgi:hypothetical protein